MMNTDNYKQETQGSTSWSCKANSFKLILRSCYAIGWTEGKTRF